LLPAGLCEIALVVTVFGERKAAGKHSQGQPSLHFQPEPRKQGRKVSKGGGEAKAANLQEEAFIRSGRLALMRTARNMPPRGGVQTCTH
jgi:hypothetical protein